MTVLFVGDLHGSLEDAERACQHAYALGIHHLVQVGDWGFLWPGHDKATELRGILQNYGVVMRFIDGNHDDHLRLRSGIVDYQSLKYMPRGSTWTDDGARYLFLGGAPSIDHRSRTPGASWWPEETITQEDVDRCLAVGPIDVMVTHDAPIIPVGFSDDVGSEWFRIAGPASRAAVAAVVDHHRPQLLVHGHWHRRYVRGFRPTNAHEILIEGLSCGSDAVEDFCLPWSKWQ